MGLLMGKFRQCLTEFSACDRIMVGYYSLMFFKIGTVRLRISKLGMCINIVEIWFGIANGQI